MDFCEPKEVQQSKVQDVALGSGVVPDTYANWEKISLRVALLRRTSGFWWMENLTMSQQCALAVWKANGTPSEEGWPSRVREVITPLCSTSVRPQLEYCIQVWGPQHGKDMELLESVQRRAAKMIRGFEHIPYEDRLKELDLFSLEKRRMQEVLVASFQYLKEFINRREMDFLCG